MFIDIYQKGGWEAGSHPGALPGGFPLLVLGIIHVFRVTRAFHTAGGFLFCSISLDHAKHSFQDWVWFLIVKDLLDLLQEEVWLVN